VKKIESYGFGKVVIDGETYRSDLIVFPDRIQDHWWRQQGHELALDDLKKVFLEKPDVLIVGTGYYGFMKVSSQVIETISKLGIDLKVEKTGQAVHRFNELSQERKVVAVLHLTC
jgi:hypothetical protein